MTDEQQVNVCVFQHRFVVVSIRGDGVFTVPCQQVHSNIIVYLAVFHDVMVYI